MSNIKEAYEAVFNENGTVKLCGRDMCSILIQECEKIDSTRYYGNKITGVMDIQNIENLYKSLK